MKTLALILSVLMILYLSVKLDAVISDKGRLRQENDSLKAVKYNVDSVNYAYRNLKATYHDKISRWKK